MPFTESKLSQITFKKKHCNKIESYKKPEIKTNRTKEPFTKNNFQTRSILNNSILKEIVFDERHFNKIHFHRNRVQEIVQKQETLNAIEEHQAIDEPKTQQKRPQPRARAKALAYRDRLRYITSIVYFHDGANRKMPVKRIGTQLDSLQPKAQHRRHATQVYLT